MTIRCRRWTLFSRQISLSLVFLSWIALGLPAHLPGQEARETQENPGAQEEQGGRQDTFFAVRRAVIAQLAAEMAPRLGAGHLAILPPEVADEGNVVPEIVTGWDTVMAEELGRLREDLRFTERGALSAILREQKFGESAYADPRTAVKVGQIAAARTLLLTRLHRFRGDGPAVRVHLEAKLLDVESGEVLWARELRRGVLPNEVRLLLVAMGLGLGLPLVLMIARVWFHRRRRSLVEKKLPLALARARDSVERLERSLVRTRERFHGETSGNQAGAAVQEAFDALQPELLRVRVLPGGSAERQRGRDLAAAAGLAVKIDGLVETLHQQVETSSSAEALVPVLGDSLDTLRPMVDQYRRLFL